jgi:hypothetical protein
MNRKTVTLLCVLLALIGVAVYLFRDSFREEPIQIAYSVRPAPEHRQAAANRRDNPIGKRGFVLSFALDQKVPLKAVQVFPLAEVLTNKYPHAIWELVSDSNSVPVKSFDYGLNIRGMRPKVKGAVADPLQPGESYRIVIRTEKQTAQRDFQLPR